MSTAYSIVPSSIKHVKPMARCMRTASCMAVEGYGYDPRAGLRRAFVASLLCRTALIDGHPAAMWGVVAGMLDDSASVWLVLSEAIQALPRAILREAKAELDRVMADYPHVAATMLPDDAASIRFALHLGFGGTHRGKFEDMRVDALTNTAYRIPLGDSYAIQLTYQPTGVH